MSSLTVHDPKKVYGPRLYANFKPTRPPANIQDMATSLKIVKKPKVASAEKSPEERKSIEQKPQESILDSLQN